MRVLLVEDHIDIRRLFEQVIETFCIHFFFLIKRVVVGRITASSHHYSTNFFTTIVHVTCSSKQR